MKKGFTLAELLVTVVIIGTIFTVVFSIVQPNYSEDANYKVRFNGYSYYVESYTKEDNGKCVYLAEEELRYCGDWSVEKLNKE